MNLAEVLAQMSDAHREIAALRVEAERRERLTALMDRVDVAGAAVDAVGQWAMAQDSRKIRGASVPAHRAGLLVLTAMRYHAAALAALVEACEATADEAIFGAACYAAERACTLAMARAGQAAEAASNAEARGRCGGRTSPEAKLKADALEGQIRALAAQTDTARALAEGVAGVRGGIPLSADRLARRVRAARKP